MGGHGGAVTNAQKSARLPFASTVPVGCSAPRQAITLAVPPPPPPPPPPHTHPPTHTHSPCRACSNIKRQLKTALAERDGQTQKANELQSQLQDKKRQLFSAIQVRSLRRPARSSRQSPLQAHARSRCAGTASCAGRAGRVGVKRAGKAGRAGKARSGDAYGASRTRPAGGAIVVGEQFPAQGPRPPRASHTHPLPLPPFPFPQEREGLRQQVRQLEDKCQDFQEALQCKICRTVSNRHAAWPPPWACVG